MAKKRRPRSNVRDGLGWSLSDFGVSSGDRVLTSNPNRPDVPLFKGQGAAQATQQSKFTLGLTGGGPGQQVIPTTPGRLPNPMPQVQAQEGRNTVLPTTQAASNFITPEQQAQVQNYLNDPSIIDRTIDVTKDWMSNLFDFEDPEKEAAFGLESVWDGMLKGLDWTYDRINQGGSWLNSAAPGGIDTFTWEQAGKVSWGQSAISANAAFVNQAEQLGGPLFGAVGAAAANAMNPVGIFGSIAALGDSPIAPYGAQGFDVLNEQQRKAAFEDSTVGKWTSGLTDAAVTVFADPLLFAGKAAKLARIRWVDRPLTVEQARDELQAGAATMFAVRNGTIAAEAADSQMSPIALFAKWVSDKTDDGAKRVGLQEIYEHPVIKRAANRDGLVAALYNTDNYDEAALVIRYAKGDLQAFDELLARRADITAQMAESHRTWLEARMLANPKAKKKLEKKYENRANRLLDDLAEMERIHGADSPEYALVASKLAEAHDSFSAVTSFRIPNQFDTTVASKEAADAAQNAWKQAAQRDQDFIRVLGSEYDRINANLYALGGSTKGFAADNAFGRMVERSRQRRASATYQHRATRSSFKSTGKTVTRDVAVYKYVKNADGTKRLEKTGEVVKQQTTEMRRLRPWERDSFGHRAMTPMHIWRWMAAETPAGYITTKGLGALESTREMKAALDDIAIYSGEARTIIIDGTPIEVGGLVQKERLIKQYMDAVANDGVKGTADTKRAVDKIEEQIKRDIAAWHGIDRKLMDTVMASANNKRDKLIESIKNRGYWVETSEDGKSSVQASPYLESQLQNGTFMHNWRAVEKAARLYDEKAWVQAADRAAQFGAEKFNAAYNIFNDIWRPAVLMRLGYTQRNVAEGLFRSSAFLFSLEPLKYAAGNFAFGARNIWVGRTAQGTIEKATVALREGRPMPKKYQKWLAAQVDARDTATANLQAAIRTIEENAAPFSQEIKDRVLQRYMDDANAAADELVRLRNSNAPASQIAEARAAVDGFNAKVDEIRRIRVDPSADVMPDVEAALDNIPFLEDMLEASKAQRELLDSPDSAVALYRQQAKAKRRVFDGQQIEPDGVILREAFSRDSDYTDIALMNLSADNTIKATLALQMQSFQSLLRAQQMRFYVNVAPGEPKYWDGYADMLRQYQTSKVGRMVIEGKSRDQIASFLRGTPEGSEIAAAIGMAQVKGNKKGQIRFTLVDMDGALEYADAMIARYDQLAPSPEMQQFIRTNFLDESDDSADIVRQFLDQKTPEGTPLYDLKPVIGNAAQDLGSAAVMDIWRSVTSKAFKVLGTIPEDSLVRGPFYGMRYRDTRDQIIRLVEDQTGRKVTIREANAIQRIAHRRALKDTKDTLYTIDRRTNLGRSGEYVLPFISAAQNSVTAVGRLIWNDPSIAALMIAAWRAPTRMGIEDEEGNIHIPIPLSIIPDGIEQSLGLDSMMDFKINKGSLNVVIPESGFGVLPRFGPLVAAPASEIMKHGWFGVSVETPGVLTSVLGKEGGDAFWKTWKDYVFGESQGIAPDPGSLSMFTPPVVAKLIQMIEGEGSSPQYAYYYNLQFRNEMAKWAAGYRDAPPEKDEIVKRTNGFYMVRMLANLTAFTPPQYESRLDPIIKAIRNNDRVYGLDGTRMSNDQFGNLLLMLGDFSNTKNIAGALPTADAVGNARKYSNIIQDVSAGLGEDLSVIGMILNDDPNAFYDDSAYGWQLSNRIPGVTEQFRELQTPEMAWRESQKNAGWTAYIKLMDTLDALLEQRGLKSYRSAQAADLRQMKNDAIEQLRSNPLYAGWYDDYRDFGSTRTVNAVSLMKRALQDEQFVKDHAESPIWQAASEYLWHRQNVLDILKERNQGGINNEANQDIRQYWDEIRADLIANKNGWGTYVNRYLNGDDDPEEPGTEFSDFQIIDVPAEDNVVDYRQGTIPPPPGEVDQFGGFQ